MDRAAATSVLTEKYRELATDAKFTSQQTTDAYNGAIDMALRLLGTAETDLATTDVQQPNIIKYAALLDFFALDRFATLQSVRFDVQLPGPVAAKRSQVFDQIQKLLVQTGQKLANMGVDVGLIPVFESGRFNMDYLDEPLKWMYPTPFPWGEF